MKGMDVDANGCGCEWMTGMDDGKGRREWMTMAVMGMDDGDDDDDDDDDDGDDDDGDDDEVAMSV